MEVHIGPRGERYTIEEPITENELESIVYDPKIKVLQTSTDLREESWALINDLVLSKNPNIEIRLFGFYGRVCNLSQIRGLKNVKIISVDCLMDITGVEVLNDFENLTELSFGVYNVDNFKFLNSISPKIKRLFLGRTNSKKPDLRCLERFTELKSLYIEGQEKSIDVLNGLSELEDLTLRSISTDDITYITDLKNLTSLDIKLGGIKDLGAIGKLVNLEYLELWQVRGLNNIDFISKLSGLQYLFLQSLPNVEYIPDISNLNKLRRIYLQNMNGIKDYSNISKSMSLEELIISEALKQKPEELYEIFNCRSLKKVVGYFGSNKKNEIFKKMILEKGLKYDIDSYNFDFI